MKRLSILLAGCLLLAGAMAAQGAFTDVTYLLSRNMNAGAVAWGDINNDGWPDLVVAGRSSADTRVYLNNHEPLPSFTDATAQYTIPAMGSVRRLQLLDVDGDGLLDIFVLMNNATQIRLYRQQANHSFQAVSLTIGQPFTNPITSAVWVDMNHDGILDLVLSSGASYSEPPIVLRQRTPGHFILLRDNPFESGSVGAVAFCDFDLDGNLDVFTGYGPQAQAAHLYRNNGSSFDDWTGKSVLNHKCGFTGAVWFDYDGDQLPDLFVPGQTKEQIFLYHNTRINDMRRLESVPIPGHLFCGAANSVWADAVDVNMDGWMDLFIVRNHHSGCSLLLNCQGRNWKDVSAETGVDFNGSNVVSAAWADYDGDGAPDLAVVFDNGTVQLLRNSYVPARPFFRVNLLGTTTNTPVANAAAFMTFEHFKQMGSIGPMASGMTGDGTTLLFVDYNQGDPEVGQLAVQWPNGVLQNYPIEDLAWYGVTNLHMPTASEPTPPADQPPSVPVASAMTVSPNPFNPSTSLSFTLPNSADVSLMIYDMLGRRVADLAHGPLNAGEHRMRFDAGALPSGMYFSRLTVNGVPTVNRLMLAK